MPFTGELRAIELQGLLHRRAACHSQLHAIHRRAPCHSLSLYHRGVIECKRPWRAARQQQHHSLGSLHASQAVWRGEEAAPLTLSYRVRVAAK